MIDITYHPTHHIQRFILDVLRHNEYARFRDLLPPQTDSNLFNYHLKQLQKYGMIEKHDQGYTLSLAGLVYIDRISSINKKPRQQPKIMTMSIIANESGEVLVRYKTSQPMINKLTFIAGMQHMEDETIEDAALREIKEKTGFAADKVAHVGDCYMAIKHDGLTVMNTLMHVFLARVKKADITLMDGIMWRRPDDLADAAPATRLLAGKIAVMAPNNLFFEQYSEEL